ncbi:MAG TPA: AI-2E family transporter [Anaerolineae bacterium]|nr:AI-2E family transporter [Anaerolineae bacterium]
MTQLARSTALVLLTLAGLALLWLFLEPILIFLVAVFLAASLRPLIDRLTQRNLSAAVSLALVYLALALGIVALVLLVIGPLDQDLQDLTTRTALTYERVATQWPESDGQFQRTVAARLPQPELLYKALSGQTELPVVEGIVAMVSDLGSFLGKGIMVLILSLYWSIDQVRFERLWLSSLPLGWRISARRVWRDLENGVGAFVRSAFAQVVLSAVVFWIGFALLGVPYAALLAVLGGLVQVVPWLSVVLAPLLLLAVGLISNPTMAVIGAVYALLVSLAFEFRIQPRYFPRMPTSSLLLLIVALVLTLEAGLAGLIFAPAVTVAVHVLWIHLVEPQRRAAPAAAATAGDLEAGLSQLRETMSQTAEPLAPEVASLVNRLDGLITASKKL